jgi:superfamily II DNA helicase RecQ
MKNIDVLTIPELKTLAQRHHLNDKGKKGQLRTRISIWVRDEIVKGLGHLEQAEDDGYRDGDASVSSEAIASEDEDNHSLVSTSTSSSEESELELIGTEMVCDQSATFVHEISIDDISHRSKTAIQQDNLLLHMLQSLFGHPKFRPGQEWAIRRCLSGHRSLLVAPTGSGKSLCYALPAAMKSGVTIVVSPLISLIEDQLRALPPRLPAATLSGSLTKAATVAILDDVLRGRIKILFVSPEKCVSASFRRLFRKSRDNETGNMERRFPTVSLFCVDEAHWYVERRLLN